MDSLAFVSTKMNSEAYKNVREDYILPDVIDLAGEKLIFLLDDTLVHKGRLLKTYSCFRLPVQKSWSQTY